MSQQEEGNSSLRYSDEVLNEFKILFLALITHLKKALNRIEDKTYGICKETGKLIEKDILLALPHEKK